MGATLSEHRRPRKRRELPAGRDVSTEIPPRKEYPMAKTTPRQRKTLGRVMHEYTHGELKSGPGGKGGKVKSRRQAIAIALHEAGASKYDSDAANRRSRARTQRKEARGKTAQQAAEGRSHVGARGRRESSPAMGGKNATRTTRRGRKAANARARRGPTRAELYRRAQARRIEGRSKMTKQQLSNALARS
jgi:uncharacterized protein DUF6496